MITVLNVLKRRNNAVSNLVVGISGALSMLGVECEVVPYTVESIDGTRYVDPQSISSRTRWLIVPYWISGHDLWSINLAELKERHPRMKIALFTGTSPFWHGCPWIDYNPGSRGLKPSGLSDKEKANFKAVDLFFVVTPRPEVRPRNQITIGMGSFSEVHPGPKSSKPIVVLDFLKKGWDEPSYEDACSVLSALSGKHIDLTLVILGDNDISKRFFPSDARHRCIPHDFIPFHEMCGLWRSSWAFVCHNESFGYPIVENWSSGTPVFTSDKSEIPTCHPVRGLCDLEGHLASWSMMDVIERNDAAKNVALRYTLENPLFCSWEETAKRAMKAFTDFEDAP